MAKKLVITACTVSKSGKVSPTKKSFKLRINPAEFKQGLSVTYKGISEEEAKVIGRTEASPTFGYINAETLDFSFIIDGTGVVPATKKEKVADTVEELRQIVYAYNGKIHEPNVCRLVWGDGLKEFEGRLTKMDVNYTLFRPSGEALRAKVSLNFTSFATQKEAALIANKSSPDMTHKVIVEAGDTLPLLCERIYNDPLQYQFIARRNRLSGFRDLVPGTELEFPPIR